MEYILIIAQGAITAAFGIISWRVKLYLDETARKEEELRLRLEEERKRIETMREANNRGTQALLRDRLLQGYHFYKSRGCVTYGEDANYENMYEAYHALGKNGIMDGIHEDFKTIPVKADAEVYPNEVKQQ